MLFYITIHRYEVQNVQVEKYCNYICEFVSYVTCLDINLFCSLSLKSTFLSFSALEARVGCLLNGRQFWSCA